MKNRLLNLFLAVLMSSFIISCSTQQKINKYNSANSYVDEYPGGFMQEQIFHKNDTISELYVRIEAMNIPSLRSKQVDVYSYLTFQYEEYTPMNKKDLVQSQVYKLSDLVPYDMIDKGGVSVNIPLKLHDDQNYIILLSVQDQLSKKNYFKLLRINKSASGPENFKITDADDQVLWHSWIEKNQALRIHYRYPTTQEVQMSYFEPKFSPAKPPFVEDVVKNSHAFETYDIRLDKGVSQLIQLPREGVYLLKKDSAHAQGLYRTQFYEGFPSVDNPAQKVFALRYLNTRKEFYAMLQDDPAHTLQEFWFFDGRSEERSQKMMTTYYSRVQRANELFTSHKEGWKTDRGMIFIVYGPPDHIYNESDSEVWEYGEDADYNDLSFEFKIQQTNLNSQDYILIRDKDYKESWFQLVKHWRED